MQNQANTSIQKERWGIPLLILLALQLLMISSLLLIVNSPWYSEFFNRRMRDILCFDYRNGTSSGDLPMLEKALAFSKRTKRTNLEDLDLTEEIFLRAPLAESKGNSLLLKISKDKSQDESTLEVAKIKLLREALAQAEAAIAEKNAAQGSSSLERARTLLAKPCGERSRQRFVRQYLLLSTKLALLHNDKRKAQQLSKVLQDLLDPQKSKEWYEANNIAGYNSDYSAAYNAGYWAHNLHPELGWETESKALVRALDACATPECPPSLGLGILLHASSRANVNHDSSIPMKIFDVWIKNFSNKVPNTSEERYIIPALFLPAVTTADPEKALIWYNRFLDLVDNGLISDPSDFSIFLEDFCNRTPTLHISPPSEKNLDALFKLSLRCEEIAKKKGLDNTAILLEKVECLAYKGQLQSAQDLLFQLAKRPAAQKLKIGKRNCIAYLSVPIYRQISSKEGRQPAFNFITKVVNLNNWNDHDLVGLLIDQTESSVDDQGQLSKPLDRLILLSKKKLPEDVESFADEFILRSLAWQNRISEANNEFKRLRLKYAKSPQTWQQICQEEINRLRALPALVQNTSKPGDYPEAAAYEDIAISKKLFGAKSAQSSIALGCTLEYEFCKGNKSKSLELCNQLLQEFKPNETTFYVSALIIKSAITGTESQIPSGKIVCKEGTLAELLCLESLLTSAKRPDLVELAKTLSKNVIEK